MPRAPPVTIATLSFSLMRLSLCCRSGCSGDDFVFCDATHAGIEQSHVTKPQMHRREIPRQATIMTIASVGA
jgi:hypothetical protein